MTDRSRLGDFLRARRELLQPEDVGIPRDTNRRVPGLRRPEVAGLAGISPEYYLRLEQGHDHQPSEQVLLALGRALRLDADGVTYLFRLAHPPLRRTLTRAPRVAPGVLRLLEQWSHTPAYVTDRNQDVLAVNALARAMAPGYLEPGANLVMSMFTNGPRDGQDDGWRRTAEAMVAALRFQGEPSDLRLQEIVGTLSVTDREFRRIWASHDARPQTSGTAPAHIAPVGWVDLRWQTLDVPGIDGHFLTTFYGEPGSLAAIAVEHLVARTAAIGRERTAQDSAAPGTSSVRRASAS